MPIVPRLGPIPFSIFNCRRQFGPEREFQSYRNCAWFFIRLLDRSQAVAIDRLETSDSGCSVSSDQSDNLSCRPSNQCSDGPARDEDAWLSWRWLSAEAILGPGTEPSRPDKRVNAISGHRIFPIEFHCTLHDRNLNSLRPKSCLGLHELRPRLEQLTPALRLPRTPTREKLKALGIPMEES